MLRLELRGHGESMRRDKLNMEIWPQDLLGILKAEDDPYAVLIEHSPGSQLAIHLASYQADQVKGLVLIGPVFEKALKGSMRWARYLRPVIALLVGIIRLLNRLGLYRRHLPSRDPRALDEKMRTTSLASGQYEEMIDRYSSPWPDLKVFPAANFIREIMQMVRSCPSSPALRCPCLSCSLGAQPTPTPIEVGR